MSWLSEVKERLDIVDFMRQDGLDLKAEGSGRYTCRCPFHAEKTPSFKVSEAYQNYKCFGCGEFGDVIQFYAKRNVLDYYTAALMLAKQLGIKVNNSENEINRAFEISKLYELTKDLEKFYSDCFKQLNEYHPAKQQILSRGLSINEDYGYAPSDNTYMISYMESKGYTIEQLKELGFVNENNNIQLRDRLVFFIRNYMGRTIGFTGRSLIKEDNGYKYVNSKSSAIFDKSNALYNIDKAKKKAREESLIYIVEGQFDVMAMREHGYDNTVCISGTAFSEKIIRDLLRCVGDDGKIILMLDGDKPGKAAMIKIFQNTPSLHRQLYIIDLPIGIDPCDYLATHKKVPDYELMSTFMYEKIKSKYPTNILDNRSKFVRAVQDNLTNYMTDKQLREQYLRNACILAGLDFNNIKDDAPVSNVNKVKEEDYILPLEDKYFISAISFYIINHKNILSKLDKNLFPERYHNYIDEVNNMINDNKKFVTENFTQRKLAEITSQINTDVVEDSNQATSHYNSLINFANKAIRDKESNTNITNLINNAQGLDTEQIIELLNSLG